MKKRLKNKFNLNQTMRNRMRVKREHRMTRRLLPQIHTEGVEENFFTENSIFTFYFLIFVISYIKKEKNQLELS